MASLSQSTADTRAAVARMVAKYFIVHLQAEVQKPDEVLLEVFKDLPVRQLNVDMIARVREEFAIPESEPLPALNLFKSWCEINGKFGYEDSGFFGYNRIFAHRLTSLREGTPEAQERHFNAMRKAFDSFDYEKEGFTVAFFLESEHNMRELLRQAAREHLPGNLEADQIVLNQSRAYQVAMYEYFEGVLKATLADNLRLLHGILPQQVASELRRNGHVEPVLFRDAAVIFTDFENFSNLTAYLPPGEVIHRLDTYFSEFDRISAAHGLERIKTIGDSYMAVAGVPESHANPVLAACDTALEILSASQRISAQANDGWNIRIGIHVGPLVAGVIGKQKFSYDVWGATVNFASRMESSGAPGRINVSAVVHDRVEPSYVWEARGAQPIKRLGLAEMFFLLGKKQAESTTRR